MRIRCFKDGAFARFGFTLMEVNLAIFVMATGLLAMVALYPLAYRESLQSQEDVVGAVAANSILDTLSGALSSRNIEWDAWQSLIGDDDEDREDPAVLPDEGKNRRGWLGYMDKNGNAYTPQKRNQINSTAAKVFEQLMNVSDKKKSFNQVVPADVQKQMAVAIVAQWGRLPVYLERKDRPRSTWKCDPSRIVIGVRVAGRAGELMSQPMYYTEVHFQGDQNYPRYYEKEKE